MAETEAKIDIQTAEEQTPEFSRLTATEKQRRGEHLKLGLGIVVEDLEHQACTLEEAQLRVSQLLEIHLTGKTIGEVTIIKVATDEDPKATKPRHSRKQR